jgi:hypothetical protein
MSKAEKNAIATPANGLLVYQNAPDSVGFYYYNGSAWVWLQNARNDWNTLGNATTDTATNFLGTTNQMPLRFKLDNTWTGQWDNRLGNYGIGLNANKNLQPPTGGFDSRHNIALGNNTLAANISGNNNIAIGENALKLNQTGFRNFAIGSNALTSITNGDGLYAIGDGALQNNTFGAQNYAIGQFALNANTTGSLNLGIGYFALSKNTTGNRNYAIGHSALGNNISGFENIAIGIDALRNNTANNNLAFGNSALRKNTTGTDNIAIGNFALDSCISGAANVAIGKLAIRNNIFGDDNVAIGFGSGYNNTTQSGNIFLGYQAGYNAKSANKLYIENSTADSTAALIYGDFAADSLRLNAAVTVRDYTRLGTRTNGAPAIKMKKITVQSSGTLTGEAGVSHLLTSTKIISVTTLLEWTAGTFAPPEYSVDPQLRYNFYVTTSEIRIRNNGSGGTLILNKPVTILITYEE